MPCFQTKPYPPPRPPRPCPPPKPCGCAERKEILLQRVVARERRSIPCLCTELKLEELSPCAQAPFRVLMVQQSGKQPWWTPLDGGCGDRRLRIRVFIPVCCQVMDAQQKLYCASAVVETETTLQPPCPPSECWKHQLVVVPCVRLLECAECCDCAPCRVKLEVQLEVYLLHPETGTMRKPEPACPELPLYPQPCCGGMQTPWPRQE